MAFPLPHFPAGRAAGRPHVPPSSTLPTIRSLPTAVRPAVPRRALAAALPLLVVAASGCGGSGDDGGAGRRGRAASGGRGADPSGLLIAPLPTPYQVAGVVAGGSVEGVVQVEGEMPKDTTVRPAADQAICGASILDTTIDADGGKLAGVVVWLDDVQAGKAIPLARRFELTNDGCRLTPRVQAAIAGGTLNVRSVDPVLHRTRFIGGPVSRPVTLAEINQTDEGQVVPNEDILRAPGMIEVRCETHPWSRAYLAVFDHPYFSVSRHQGVFAIDSVPPGRHRLVAWHERFGRVEQTVEVKAGEVARVTVKLNGRE